MKHAINHIGRYKVCLKRNIDTIVNLAMARTEPAGDRAMDTRDQGCNRGISGIK